jgi:hypothetical protein
MKLTDTADTHFSMWFILWQTVSKNGHMNEMGDDLE